MNSSGDGVGVFAERPTRPLKRKSSVRMPTGRLGRLLWIGITHNWIAVAVGALYLAIVFVRFGQRRVGIDAAIFDQAITRYAHLQAPDVLLKSVQPFNLLGDHFSPALILLAPVFRLFPSVLTLLVLQAVLFAVSVSIVGATARRLRLQPGLAAGLTWAFGLSIGMVEAINFDLHEVSLTVPVLAGALGLLLTGRIVPGSLLLASTMAIREDNAVLLVGVGLVLLTLHRWRPGLVLIVGGAAAFLLVVTVVIPAFNHLCPLQRSAQEAATPI